MAEHNEASLLRLASAKRRVAAFLKQVAELRASSFPHDDGDDALDAIESVFIKEQARLDIPPGVQDAVIDEMCLHVTKQLSAHTDILGFILRSTNVRNPFELHFALAKLVKMAIGNEVQVLISSEWDFIPFTYPMSLEFLPTFVLIGSPAPESGNVLIAPLAGHEIGHTAWREYDCVNAFVAQVSIEVDAALKRHPLIEKRLLQEAQLDVLGRSLIVDRCGDSAQMQLEEIFCDLFGLFVFGSSYMFAYDYFLAPGDSKSFLDYPPDHKRMTILGNAATEKGIAFDRLLLERWQTATIDASQRDMETIVGEVVDTLVPMMRDALFAELEHRQIPRPDAARIAAIRGAFDQLEPYAERATLAEVVSAGWSYLRDKKGLADKAQWSEYEVLSDLMLKSIEVAEFLERLDSDA
ncbi:MULTISPECIES: hypothetical protein [Sphingobium]|uniref:hypothetical protein n=1 Tax=Sphingobium TaxID=165695 RepID=UPI0015EC1C16|nr:MULTISPECIES: hypothetical protein [Sphingobium]MCW2363161.1 hypothetical protein [Sphingobium sp. B10D3B]MCW2400159.1 hypothetical protein [Sphingobium sp. B10D7B]MCW2407137.1 hypothetical protein [Sphingobium xanthum]